MKQIQDFKRSLPKETKLVVCKNTLMRRAADSVEGWAELKQATKVRAAPERSGPESGAGQGLLEGARGPAAEAGCGGGRKGAPSRCRRMAAPGRQHSEARLARL